MTSLLTKLTLIGALIWAPFSFAINIGDQAPNFSLISHQNKKISLRDFENKIIVLEWFNKGCPFVKKFYESTMMQKWQKDLTEQGIIWLTISSSAKGKQGHETIGQVNETRSRWKINSTHNLLDHKGEVGQLYGAKTTPHIFVIDQKMQIAYQGAIDSILSADAEDIPKAVNYLKDATNALLKKNEVKIKKTKPYGCSIKY